MAFPVDANQFGTNGSTAATNKVCNVVTAAANGDLLILILRSAGADTHTTPTGWTELVLNDTSDGSDDTTSIWWKRAGSPEADSVTINGTASLKFAARSWQITGADSPPQISSAATGASTTPDPPNLATTPSGVARDYLWMWIGAWEGEQTSPPAGAPTNYSNAGGNHSGTASTVDTNCRVAGATRQNNGSSEDPPSWTISASDQWTAWTIAVPPKDSQVAEITQWHSGGMVGTRMI